VPIDILRSSVSQIIEHGKVIRPILGIAFAPEQSVEQARSTKQGIVCVCVDLANFGKFRICVYGYVCTQPVPQLGPLAQPR